MTDRVPVLMFAIKGASFMRFAAALLLLSGCFSTGVLMADDSPADRLHALIDEAWEREMRESPTWASALGDRRFHREWPDRSFEALERSHQANVELLHALDAIHADELSPADRINCQLFRRDYEVRVEGYQYRWYLVSLNQREGIQDEGSLADSLTFQGVEDYEDWLARMRAFPLYMDQTIALMREGAAHGVIHPRVVMERVPSQIAKQIVDDPTEQLFYKPFRNMPASIPFEDQERLRAEAVAAVNEHIVPAYQRFAAFFDEVYLPACHAEVGVWQVPRGDELYAFRCREFTTLNLTPDEIHEIGLNEVARIRAEMEDVIEQTGFEGSFVEFLDFLRNDPQFYCDDPNDLMLEYLAVCKRIDPQLVRLFRTLPRIPYGLEAIPDHIAPDTTAAYYRPPSADGSRAGTYFVNLFRPDSRPRYEIEVLSVHEAVPGHHLQIALAHELEGLPEFRRFSGYTAYVEGWALYSESLGEELGLYQDPYSKFGQLTYEMWRAVRLVIDTGMHHKRWTREEAIDYFARNTAKTMLDIENEVDRYIAWPGQALAYKIGELKIQELRRLAEERLGDEFDIREFHDVVLRNGAVTLGVLEEIVKNWLDEKTIASDHRP
jgi:prolyl oligopeptidase